MTVDPARTAVDEGAVAEPAWKGIARQLEAEHAARAGGPAAAHPGRLTVVVPGRIPVTSRMWRESRW